MQHPIHEIPASLRIQRPGGNVLDGAPIGLVGRWRGDRDLRARRRPAAPPITAPSGDLGKIVPSGTLRDEYIGSKIPPTSTPLGKAGAAGIGAERAPAPESDFHPASGPARGYRPPGRSLSSSPPPQSSGSASPAEEACPDGYSEFDGASCFAVYCDRPQNASVARETCTNDGGALAQIDSAEQNDFVAKLLRRCNQADYGLIGLTSEGNDDNSCWYWTQGASTFSNYTNWAVGQPSNLGEDQECVALCTYWDEVWCSGKWHDVPCSEEFLPVCRFDIIMEGPLQNQTSAGEHSVNNCSVQQSNNYNYLEVATIVAKFSGLLSIVGSLFML